MNPDIAIRLIIIHENKILLVNNVRDHFYYLPGGKMQKLETLTECAEREVHEELGPGVEFTFQKVLYIKDFILKELGKHKFEVFILGKLNVFEEIQGASDPQHDQDFFTWMDLNEIPKTFKPYNLIEILQKDFKNGFKNSEIQYIA